MLRQPKSSTRSCRIQRAMPLLQLLKPASLGGRQCVRLSVLGCFQCRMLKRSATAARITPQGGRNSLRHGRLPIWVFTGALRSALSSSRSAWLGYAESVDSFASSSLEVRTAQIRRPSLVSLQNPAPMPIRGSTGRPRPKSIASLISKPGSPDAANARARGVHQAPAEGCSQYRNVH